MAARVSAWAVGCCLLLTGCSDGGGGDETAAESSAAAASAAIASHQAVLEDATLDVLRQDGEAPPGCTDDPDEHDYLFAGIRFGNVGRGPVTVTDVLYSRTTITSAADPEDEQVMAPDDPEYLDLSATPTVGPIAALTEPVSSADVPPAWYAAYQRRAPLEGARLDPGEPGAYLLLVSATTAPGPTLGVQVVYEDESGETGIMQASEVGVETQRGCDERERRRR